MQRHRPISWTLFLALAFFSPPQTLFANGDVAIKSVKGVASYPEGYQGTPHRKPEEDPFLSPSNAALVLIDYQPHILMGVRNIDHETLIHNTTALIKSATHFGLPIIFSHVGVGYNDAQPFLEALRQLAPQAIIIDRTNVNAWEEPEFVAAIENLGRKKLIMGGLWTDVCLAYPPSKPQRPVTMCSCRRTRSAVLRRFPMPTA